MNDVLQIARERRARLMTEIENHMAEIERLDEFVAYGSTLAGEPEAEATAKFAAE